MSYKIVADSSADKINISGVATAIAPLKIITNEREFIDDENLNTDEMVAYLKGYSGKSSTACPGVNDWLTSFGESENIFCITISSNLSGSFNSACLAASEYETLHPNRNVFVIDSLSTGGEMQLIIERLEELILSGIAFDEICKKITEYQQNTGLLFMLQSLKNLANNGRVSHAVAKISGILGIRIIGLASDEGRLDITDKSRGDKKALASIIERMKIAGCKNGKIRISHCQNKEFAEALKTEFEKAFNTTDIKIQATGGLCSFYAESGGIIIGFEK